MSTSLVLFEANLAACGVAPDLLHHVCRVAPQSGMAAGGGISIVHEPIGSHEPGLLRLELCQCLALLPEK